MTDELHGSSLSNILLVHHGFENYQQIDIRPTQIISVHHVRHLRRAVHF